MHRKIRQNARFWLTVWCKSNRIGIPDIIRIFSTKEPHMAQDLAGKLDVFVSRSPFPKTELESELHEKTCHDPKTMAGYCRN